MKQIFAIAATAIALTSTTVAPVKAGPITSLEECYNAVLTWCNETFPDMDCSNASGLDDCDDEFGTASHNGGGLQVRPNGPVTPERVMARIVRLVEFQEEQRESGRENDNDDGRDGGRDADSRPGT